MSGISSEEFSLQFDNLPRKRPNGSPHGYTVALIVPTGIGASIGGYAGDALPVARAFASVADTVLTHPNVMNGASLYWPQDNILYVEGYALDEVAKGNWGLLPVVRGSNRIGLLLDAAMDEDMRLRHVQAARAARATLGVDVAEYAVTDAPIGVTLRMSPGGASWGAVDNPGTVLRGARRLVEEGGCTAIALVARFPEDEDPAMLQAYREGGGVDAVGGAEAILSHLVVQELKIPCAHAPGLDPLALALGATPGALVVAVEENATDMRVSPADLGFENAVVVRSYFEALGVVAAHRAGINGASLTASENQIQFRQ